MPRGRKSKGNEGFVAFRLSVDLRQQLQRAADEKGHTLSDEIRHRLARTFDTENVVERFGGERSYAFCRLLSLLWPLGEKSGRHWIDDRYQYLQIATAIRVILLALEPKKGPRRRKGKLDPEWGGLRLAAFVLKCLKEGDWLRAEVKRLKEAHKRQGPTADLGDPFDMSAESLVRDSLANVITRAPDDLLNSPIVAELERSKS